MCALCPVDHDRRVGDGAPVTGSDRGPQHDLGAVDDAFGLVRHDRRVPAGVGGGDPILDPTELCGDEHHEAQEAREGDGRSNDQESSNACGGGRRPHARRSAVDRPRHHHSSLVRTCPRGFGVPLRRPPTQRHVAVRSWVTSDVARTRGPFSDHQEVTRSGGTVTLITPRRRSGLVSHPPWVVRGRRSVARGAGVVVAGQGLDDVPTRRRARVRGR